MRSRTEDALVLQFGVVAQFAFFHLGLTGHDDRTGHGESSRKLTECMAWLQAIEGQLTGLLIEDAAHRGR